MGTVLQEIRFALRVLAKNPGLTFIAILTLALGIGANTAIFSLTDQVLLRDLPVKDPAQLVILRSPGPHRGHTWSDGDDAASFSYLQYQDIRRNPPAFSGVLARFETTLSVAGLGETERARGELVSGNYFDVLGVRPALGRTLTMADETSPGANPVAVLSYGYWMRKFAGDSSILNKSLTVNGTPLTIVGVSQQGFTGVQIGQLPDVFIPLTMKPQIAPEFDSLADRTDRWLSLIARMNAGLTIPRAEAEMQPYFSAIVANELPFLKLSDKTAKEYADKKLLLQPGEHGRMTMQNQFRAPLLSLMAMVGVVLLIACANLASLLVAHGETRQRDVAVRLALGAGRGRLVRQFLTEALLLAIGGGAAGLAAGAWMLRALAGTIPADASLASLNSGLNWRVALFAGGASVLTAILFGLAPALRATRANIETTLRDQGATTSASRSSARFRKWLVASQVALTVVLLAGAGFFVESLLNLRSAKLGVQSDRVVQFAVDPGESGYTLEQTHSYVARLSERIAALPGVSSVSAARIPLFEDDDSSGNVTIEGYQPPPDVEVELYRNQVAPDYFSTMGIPLIAGREFRLSDTATSPKVAIINQETARLYFAGRNPVGLRIARGSGNDVHPDIEIVGVVANSKDVDIRTGVRPFIYTPYAQDTRAGGVTLYVKTQKNPASMIAAMKQAAAALDSNVPVFDAKSLDAQIQESVYTDWLLTFFAVSLAGLAALLAAIGLYGVLAFLVAGRTREIGIRIALGATQGNVSWLVLREIAVMCAVGLGAGLAAAYVAGRLIESQLYEVTAASPGVYVAAGLALLCVAWLAGWLPARRAAAVDPMVALRYE